MAGPTMTWCNLSEKQLLCKMQRSMLIPQSARISITLLPFLEHMIATVGTSNGVLDWDFPKVVSKAKLLSWL